ncbi:4Fe-4S binding protein [Variovorax sp. YR216]
MSDQPTRPHRPVGLPEVDAARCTGCSDCAVACPFRVISMRRVD